MKSSKINKKQLDNDLEVKKKQEVLVEKIDSVDIDRDITTQKGNEKGIQEFDVGHYTLFEDAPISYWVEDFSGVKKQIDKLKKKGIKNLRKYLEEHPDILLEMISNIQILDVNRRTLEIFQGDNKDQFLGNLSKFASEKALDAIKEEIIALDEGNLPFYAELMNTTLKGKEIWVNVQLSIPPDAQDTWTPVLVSINDITDRKQTENVLLENEANISSIFRASPVGIGQVIERKILNVNERFCEMVGYTNEELIGKNARMVYPSDEEYERVGNEKYRKIEKFGIGTIETVFQRKDKERIHVLLSSTPINSLDLSQGTTFTALDITEKKRAEKNFKDLVEQTLMGLLVVQDFRIKFVNDAFCQITGYSREECLSLSQEQVQAMIHEEDQNIVWGRFRDRMVGKEISSRYQYRGIKKNGEIVWLDMSASIVDFDGKPAIQGAVVDITDQVNSANQLRISEEKYRDVFDNVSDFLYIHDLEGNLVETNLAWQEKLGYSEQELSNLNLKEIIPSKFHSEFSGYIKTIIKEGQAEGLLTIKSKRGQIRIGEYKNSLILESGKPKMVRGSARDITDRLMAEKELQASEIRFRSLIEQSPISTILYRPDGRPIYGNNASLEIWNLGPDLLENLFDTYNMLEDQQLIDQGIMPFIEKGFAGESVETPPIKYDPSQTNPDYKGPAKWLRASIYPVHDDHGNIRELVVIHEDITDRTKSEKALQESESKYRTLINNINLGIFRTSGDPSGDFIHANPALAKMFGFESVEDLMNSKVKDLYNEESDRRGLLDELKSRGSVTNKELQLIKRDGSLIWTRLNATPYLNDAGEILWLDGIIEDITERKKLEEQLIHQAFHDELTELPNRALFKDRLERAISRGKRDKDFLYAVLFMDLDRFKNVNDSLGHNFGDKVLWVIARNLEGCVREVDTVARFSGDEYIILLEDIQDIHDPIRVAARINDSLSHTLSIEQHQIIVTGSIGISMKTGGDISADAIIQEADSAMYRAKALGKNRFEIFDSDMIGNAVDRLKLETDLRNGLEQNQIRVHFQPIYNLSTGKLDGFEALVRWDHPTHGLLYPEDFLALAEETGMVIDLGRIVLNNAINSLQSWIEQLNLDSNITVSVNLSERQLLDPGLIVYIKKVLKSAKLDPHNLKLEITEATVMRDIDDSILVLNTLKKMGIDSQMDDFGKGYSSLSMLHKLPVKTVKIDREFVNDISKGGVNVSIVRTIVTLAKELGMDTIAEGIEQKKQIKDIIEAGCKFGQGYFYSEPLSGQAVRKLIRDLKEL